MTDTPTVKFATQAADQFEVKLTWCSQSPLLPGRMYRYQSDLGHASASITTIKFRLDELSPAHLSAAVLHSGESGIVNLSLTEPVRYACENENLELARFTLCDDDGLVVAQGMIHFALQRAANVHWQCFEIDKPARAAMKGQTPRCIWLTGLPGSGKSTIANLLEKGLTADGRHTYLLDGDNVRHGLNRDLGFTEADRVENIRRVAEVAKLMVDAGLIVLVAFISPYRAERRLARSLFSEGEFIEVFVDTPIAECERRDPKGLYAKARRGELKNFTGIDSAYEVPEAPEIHLLTADIDMQTCVDNVVALLA